jgi:hypothetical protein
MARAGRKRKDVARKAGRIDWWERREDPAVATKWHIARDHFLEGLGGNPRLASQAGKMFSLRYLTELEVEAADRWCEMLAAYRRVVVGRAADIRGSPFDRVGTGITRERDPEWIAAFRERFEAAQSAILAAGGKPALSAINRLCRDEAASSVLREAKRALAALIAHFRLQPQKEA